LVEYNRINQIVATKILTKLNLSADIAANGIEAIDKLNSAYYDLILMDCQMPEMDGYETTKAIREAKAGKEPQDIIIIAMTANSMKGDKEKCLNAGMNDYLAKPIAINIIQQKLKA
jgi:two-component system sensor histidine kinase/response regulator